MRPWPWRAHDRHDAPCQIMPAEHIGFKLFAQRIHRHVFDRARLGIAAIVEQGIQRAAGCGQHIIDQSFDRNRIAVIEEKSLETRRLSAGQCLPACGLWPARASHLDVAHERNSAPIPDEQPVTRMVFLSPIHVSVRQMLALRLAKSGQDFPYSQCTCNAGQAMLKKIAVFKRILFDALGTLQ